jgi:hypothetical protein
MSVMSEVAYDIEQLFIDGEHPTKISKNLGIPLSLVYDWLESNGIGEFVADEFDPHGTINS